MAKVTLSLERKKHLARLGNTQGAKRYGEWLGGRAEGDGEARLAAAREAARGGVGYGAAGERLAASGLADDGYAAYLRQAAREARSARTAALEAEREGRDLAALRGYAEYLEAERAASGERLISLAEELVSSPITSAEAARRISVAHVSPAAAAALTAAHRYEGGGEDSDTSQNLEGRIVSYLKESRLPYSRARRYCLSLGFSEEEAERLVREAEASYGEGYRRLHALFEK